jgi:GT2 family glycosyltransferase
MRVVEAFQVDLSIIIVNWNSVEYVLDCIPSILRWTASVRFEVIVIDNASPKGNIDEIATRFPQVQLVRSKHNLGFAGANNLGFGISTGEYVLFLNPDTQLTEPAIDKLMAGVRSLSQPGIVGCRLMNTDGSVQTSSIMKFPRILTTVFQWEPLMLRWPKWWGIAPLLAPQPGPAPVEAISGACMLVRRDVFEKIGGFDESYFMYSEDVDLCYEAARAGFVNYYIPDASIVHHGGKSSSRQWQTAMKMKAELDFCDKHYGRLYRIGFRAALVANALVRLALVAAVSGMMRAFGSTPRATVALDRVKKWRVILRTLLGLEAPLQLRPQSS